jgi:hypothetical protein
MSEEKKKSFLQTVPGTVAAIAAMVTAVAGAVPVIMAVRGGDDAPSSASKETPGATATPTAGETASGSSGDSGSSSPALLASPKTLDFGRVVPGLSSPSGPVQVTNTGREPVTLGRIYIVGPGRDTFSITDPADNTCQEGRELDPEENCEVKVRFFPPTRGDQKATLVIDASPSPRLEVDLSGEPLL